MRIETENRHVRMAVVVLCGAVFAGVCSPAAGAVPEPPDLTKGERDVEGAPKFNIRANWNLGPTGMRGWIFTKAANNLDLQQGRMTAASRQILVADVGEDTPAAGLVRKGDVILGVGGKRFTADARKSMGRAITAAEATDGLLKLTIWREPGAIHEVELTLPVLGVYRRTMPYDCEKSAKILAAACRALERESLGTGRSMWSAVNALALLATGRETYLPTVRAFAHALAGKLVTAEEGGAWDCGYHNLFLAEYYLLTKDKQVLPAIEVLTVKLAKGQGRYGTFGHGFSELTATGGLHGAIPPYGALNQAGLIATLAIVMGRKCGIRHPEIDPAIERANRFYSYYVDKGSIPYGEHEPFMCHENNGKNALAAVLFSIQGPRWRREATYYARMAVAGYANREYGHTGQGFSYLWSALGANVGGPAAVGAFLNEVAWGLDLARRSDGAFTYDGGEQCGPGIKSEEDSRYFGNATYSGLSPTASYVLTFALPFKTLFITGKALPPGGLLSEDEVRGAIASGCFDETRHTLSVPGLIAALRDWSPIARGWAAEELARRPGAADHLAELIEMAQGTDRYAREGACVALGLVRSDAAIPVLLKLMRHDDREMRALAAQALRKYGDAARPAVSELLKIIVANREPTDPINWDDPVQLAQFAMAETTAGLLRNNMKEVDRSLLYEAIRTLVQNPSGRARGALAHIFENELTREDVQALRPVLVAAVKTASPADTMFRNVVRMAALKALAKYRFDDAIELAVIFARTQGGHGSESRTGELMKILTQYGAAARGQIPNLRKLLDELNEQVANRKFPGGELNKRRTDAVRQAIETIEHAESKMTPSARG